MNNYPDITWNGDPRAPWNQKSAWEYGLTCGDCGRCYEAPKEWATRKFAFCPVISEYVTPEDEACDDIEVTEKGAERLRELEQEEREEAKYGEYDEYIERKEWRESAMKG